MRPGFIGMRWWLGLAFAGVAALTAVAVVALLSAHSEQAFRRYGKEFALGNSVAAAESLKANKTPGGVARHAMRIAEAQHLAIFVFDSDGRRSPDPLVWASLGRSHRRTRRTEDRALGLPVHPRSPRRFQLYGRATDPSRRRRSPSRVLAAARAPSTARDRSNRIPPVRPDRIRRRCRARPTHRRLDRSAPGQNRPCGQRHRRWKLRCRGDLELPRRSREPRALDRADADAAPGSVPDIRGRPRSSRAPARPAKRRRTARRPGAEDRVRQRSRPRTARSRRLPRGARVIRLADNCRYPEHRRRSLLDRTCRIIFAS